MGEGIRSREFLEDLQFAPRDSCSVRFSPELYTRSRSVLSRVVAGEVLVVSANGGIGDMPSLCSLNETATVIWEALEKPRSLQEICDLIEHKYEIAIEKAEQEDILLFVHEMCSLGLVEAAVHQKGQSILARDENCGSEPALVSPTENSDLSVTPLSFPAMSVSNR